MRGLLGLGIVLLIVGLAILALPAITYTDRETAVDIGPIEVETEREKQIALPPILGIATAAAGVALIVVGRRRA
ncbi:MAG TPA: hypothetical protein VFS23_14720 [Vicinamibacterales bacterium]|nr:hypothetical protein [Vicinamibacterales bacterium]